MHGVTARSQLQPHGFSMVDLMVGIAMGLLVMLVIMQVFAFWEGQKRTTTGGGDAQSAGATALYLIERDVRIAGYGMGLGSVLGCRIRAQHNNTPIALSMVPLIITDGANGAADTIEITAAGSDAFTVPVKIVKDHPPQATNFCLASNIGVKAGDLMIAFDPNEPAKHCTLVQVTNIPNYGSGGPGCSIQFQHQNTSPWNPPGGQNIFPDTTAQTDANGTTWGPYATAGYPKNSLIFNFGALINRIYSVNANADLVLTQLDMASGTFNTFPLMSQIVNLQAQYGKDTNGDGIADVWDNVTPATNAEWQQLIAARIAIVARSQTPERDVVTDASFATNNAPTWAAALIDLTKNPDGSANPDWDHYRYRIYTAVIPLRNLIWRQ